MNLESKVTSAAAGRVSQPLLTRTRVLGGLALYFLLHVLWRVLVSDSVELDESEQVISAQSWSWGYAEQPPLYTWLQKLVFGACGLNVFSLVSFKCLLLFATYYFVYRAGKEIWEEEQPALLSALCLFFIPQISWESQRDLTHSVLATALAAGTLFVFLRVAKTGQGRWYAALGLYAGLGLLAKYNYALFVLALLAAALTLPELRRRVFSPWLLVSVGIFLVVTSPHLLWLGGQARGGTAVSKLTFSGANGFFPAYLAAGKSFLNGLLNFSGPIVGIFLLLFFKRKEERSCPMGLEAKLVLRTVMAVVGICVLAVICFRAQFKPRWFQPLLFLLPIPLVAIIRSRLTLGKYWLLSGLACAAAAVILVVMPAITLGASVTERPNRLNAPWAELSRELKKNVGDPAVIVADSCLPGGNLKLHFPQALAVAPECKVIQPATNVPWLITWEAPGDRTPPPWLEELVMRLRGTKLADYKFVTAPCKYFPGREFKLGYVVLPAAK